MNTFVCVSMQIHKMLSFVSMCIAGACVRKGKGQKHMDGYSPNLMGILFWRVTPAAKNCMHSECVVYRVHVEYFQPAEENKT